MGQRSDSLYVTIALADVTDGQIALTDTSLIFAGKSNGKDYAVNIEFYEEVDSKGSTYKVLPRSIQMLVMKKSTKEDDETEFWPRLLKDKLLEKNQVKIDWDRYVDEDEEDGNNEFDQSALAGGSGMDPNNMDMASLMKQMGGMGMGGAGGMPGMEGVGGMPGMGGMPGGDVDSDDEDMPGLDENPDDDEDDMPALE